jgi:glutaredoxin
MRSVSKCAVAAILGGGLAATAGGVTVYECVDAKGERTISDHCPPNTVRAGQIQVRVRSTKPTETEKAAVEYPVLFFAVPVCDACDLVRNQLQKRGVPFVEKDPASDTAVQAELKELAGSLSVPTVTVGEEIYTGYNKQALDKALDGAGYAKLQPSEPPADADATASTTP